MSYSPVQGQIVTLQSSINVNAVGNNFDQAALTIGVGNQRIVVGTPITATLTVFNSGLNPLANGIITLTPPAGTSIAVQSLPNSYTATTLANGNIQISLLQSLAAGANIAIPATVTVNTTPTNGNVIVNAQLQANATTIIANQALVLGNTQNRTTSIIEFMQLHPLTQQLVPAVVYHATQDIWLQVADGDQNIDPYTKEIIKITLVDNYTGDSEIIMLTETGTNTGVFVGMVKSDSNPMPTSNNATISVANDSTLTATYTDQWDGVDATAAASLVDPFGKVFNTTDGSPVDGAIITMMDVNTGLPAQIFGDDGVSTFPAKIITGGTATDSSGIIYNLPSGGYRYPFVNPGTYQFIVQVPVGFTYPTLLSNTVIQTIAGAPFALTLGSRGEVFRVNPGPALHIDIPVDAKGSALFVRKAAAKSKVAIGDYIQYRVQVENTNPNFLASSVQILDNVPVGFSYKKGTTIIDGYASADPIISADARTLAFAIGTLAKATTANISYILHVGAGAILGEATNHATANANSIGQAVGSNIAKATVIVGDDLLMSKTLIAGRVFVDKNDNAFNEADEIGLAGIRIYSQDGSFVISDQDGQFHFEDIDAGAHVLQIDTTTVPERYEIAPLPNTRFAAGHVSQFVDAMAGSLVRANFRVIEKAPPQTPVHVSQHLSRQNGDVWVDIHISHDGNVPLTKYVAVYNTPDGWQIDQASATLDDKKHAPDASMIGYIWPLDASLLAQHISFRLLGSDARKNGDKESIAYARFSAPNTSKGRTGLTKVMLRDAADETRIDRDFAMRVHFDTLVAELSEQDLLTLDKIIKELQGLKVLHLHVIGHTDNVRIAPNHRDVFADNWELSKARAASIGEYMRSKLGLSAEIISSDGKADTEPVASNSTRAGKAKNRRAQMQVSAMRINRTSQIQLIKTDDKAYAIAIGSWDSVTDIADIVTDNWNASKARAASVSKYIGSKLGAVAKIVSSDGKSNTEAVANKQPVVASTPDPKLDENFEGVLSLSDGAAVPYRINAVRARLDSRLNMRLSIDGKAVTNDRIGFKSIDSKTGKTLVTYIGVDFGDPGEHTMLFEGTGPFGNARFSQAVHYVRTGEVAAIKFIEEGQNIADGKTPVMVRVQLLDDSGIPIKARIEIEMRGGDLIPMPRGERFATAEAANSSVSKTVTVERDGWLSFKPTGTSGAHQIDLGYNDVQKTIEVFVMPEYRDWILVGIAEGKTGMQQLAGKVEPIRKQVFADQYYQDGKLAFYTKGQIKGEYLLTMAFDSSKTGTASSGQIHNFINPTSRYTIYGDATRQQQDAASQQKLYIKLERKTFYALFGDFSTGLSMTELGAYTRSMSGIKSELHEKTYGYNAFVSRTSQSYIKDELRGNGTSGLYHLSRKQLVAGSEKIHIEVRDRFRSERILSSIQVQRFADYDIDYQAGTLYFKEPISFKDFDLNPIYIRVEYEGDDRADEFLNVGGRANIKPMDGLEIGTTYVQEEQLYHNNRLMAADAKIEIGSSSEIKAEAARTSAGAIPTDIKQANAYLLEGSYLGKQLNSKAYIRQQDGGFGIGQQTGSEDSTRKFGVDSRYKLSQQWSLQANANRQQALATGNTSDMANGQLGWKYNEHALSAGVRAARTLMAASETQSSKLLVLNGGTRLTNRLTVKAAREQGLGATGSSDFPTRTSLNAAYMFSESIGLDATQEWTTSQKQDSSTTRLGIKSSPWTGGQVFTRYEQELNENGTRSFANIGLKQKWTLTPKWQMDVGYDRHQSLRKPGAVAPNPNVPLASGAGENFTAASIGANYTPEGWRWNNRMDYRIAQSSRSWGVSSGVQGKLKDDLSLSWTVQGTHSKQIAGTFATQINTSLGLALRPKHDGLMLFDKFDIRYQSGNDGVFASTSWNYINNIHANLQYDPDSQVEMHHGFKWSRENIAQMPYTGITDFGLLRVRHDITPRWDASVQGALLHSWSNGAARYSYGAAIGNNVFDNVWVSLGYNMSGFSDRDFGAAGYTARGIYVDFRIKFDQNSVKDWLAE
ncbi:MAG: OmpA family protein [Mariprofundales bacterium]